MSLLQKLAARLDRKYILKHAKVLAHIAGPTASGKTTLLNHLKSEYPPLVVKDLDEFDEAAMNECGYDYQDKPSLDDSELAQVAEVREKLFLQFLKDNEDQPILLAGHHLEDGTVLPIPTENLFLLDTDPMVAASRTCERGASDTELKAALYYAKKDIRQLEELGYQKMDPVEIQEMVEMLLEQALAGY